MKNPDELSPSIEIEIEIENQDEFMNDVLKIEKKYHKNS